MLGDDAVKPVPGQCAERSAKCQQPESDHCILSAVVGVISALSSQGRLQANPIAIVQSE
jgi:hypothetical protein